MPEKKCFVISPIGEDNSDTRKRSDDVLEYIINPIVKNELGYSVTRADAIEKPGMITTQIIDRIMNDDLVIADLSEHNPNVFYELAIRHLIKKPVVLIIRSEDKIPFDISNSRTIKYDFHVAHINKCKDKLREQINAVEEDSSQVDNPISHAIDIESLRSKDKPLEKLIVKLFTLYERTLVEMSADINELKNYRIPPRALNLYDTGVGIPSPGVGIPSPGFSRQSIGNAFEEHEKAEEQKSKDAASE